MRDITHRETVERHTGQLGAAKVTKIKSILIANDQDVQFKCFLLSVVLYKRGAIELALSPGSLIFSMFDEKRGRAWYAKSREQRHK